MAVRLTANQKIKKKLKVPLSQSLSESPTADKEPVFLVMTSLLKSLTNFGLIKIKIQNNQQLTEIGIVHRVNIAAGERGEGGVCR